MRTSGLNARVVGAMLFLALVWGSNPAVVKVAYHDFSPIFMLGLRSVISSLLMAAWMTYKGVPLFPSPRILKHGVVIGLLFGTEFAFQYTALLLSSASRVILLAYTAPFFVAIMAHFILPGDRLNRWKAAGLVMAFGGIAVLFNKGLQGFSPQALPGDILALCSGCVWACTTVYLKKNLAQKSHPMQTVFYQLFFSIPLLFGLSLIFEDTPMTGFSLASGMSLFYQCVVVAFFSFLVWFGLLHKYPASLLHAFTFITPLSGVLISGVILLGEPFSANLALSLVLVCGGLLMVNR